MSKEIRSRLFSQQEIKYLIAEYQKFEATKLAVKFNKKYKRDITANQLKFFFKNNKITCGRTGRFEKGSTPWSKGTVGLAKPNSGSFSKGDLVWNRKPVGTERENPDGYIIIKTAEPSTWEFKQRVMWETHFGKIPAGHFVRIKNGSRSDFGIDDLCLVSAKESMYLSHLNFASAKKELQPVMLTLARIQAKESELKQTNQRVA